MKYLRNHYFQKALKMTAFFLVTQIYFCDTLDRVQEQKTTVTIPVKWIHVLTVIEEDEEPPINYDLEDGEIYESNKTKNSLAAAVFMANLVL
jgi:hypothetical protein